MDTKIFNKIRELVYDKCGIALGEGKEALVSARIGKRMRVLGIEDYENYLKYLENDRSGNEFIYMIDAISTNVTSFFREEKHFQLLTELMQKWLKEGNTKFRIWSAASSTGEEPYSIAMTLCEVLQHYRAEAKILATDISTKVLKLCLDGSYSEEKIKSVPDSFRHKYFTEEKTDEKKYYTASNKLKSMITFSRLNLSKPPFPMKGPFDIIFIRNVMIYFDNIVRKNLLSEALRLLKPGGYLFVGHAESLTGIMMGGLKSVQPAVYFKS